MSTISDHSSGNFLLHELTKTTPFLGLELYIVICVFLFIFVFLVLLIFLCIRRNQRSSTRPSTLASQSSGVIPLVYKEIVEVEALDLLDIEEKNLKVEGPADLRRKKQPEYDEEINVGFHRGKPRNDENDTVDGLKIGWGIWYSLEELKLATRGFADENVIGEGGYGIVYRGILQDGSVVAVKKLLNNKGQAEKEFKVEVEAIGKVKHKNLVGLIGYCAEGSQRILVYEYVENGNLEQWLHGEIGPARASPLTWDIRTRIAIGTAKGLAYLHEGLEPKVVHRDVKSSNILLDKRWNAKVSDFGLAKLLGSEKSYVSTRVMGTFGYVSPEYASTGMLNEGNDVYSFGVLLMEIITGRSPIDYSRSPAEMNLVDWFKGMVASRRGDELVDPSIEIKPSPRSLKRALLVCLRCIDMDVCKRPKMSQIVHMLEADDFPFRSELRAAREKDPVASHASVSSKISYLPKHVDSVERSRWR